MRNLRPTVYGVLLLCASPAYADSDALADQLVRDIPKLALLRTHDPATFTQIVAIYADGLQQGVPRNEMIGRARDVFAAAQHQRLIRAPDALLLRALDSMIDVARDLGGHPERCAALFSGGDAGDIKPLLSAASIVSEDAVYDATLTYPATDAPRAATVAEEDAFMTRLVARQAAQSGLDTDDFVRRMFSDPAVYCAAATSMFEEMRKAPDGAALFRRRLIGDPFG